MRYSIDNYNKVRQFVLVLLVASLPFHMHISSLLIFLGVFVVLLKSFAEKRFGFLNMDKLSAGLVGYLALETIGLLYTDRENIPMGMYTLEKHLCLILVPLACLDWSIGSKSRTFLLWVFVTSCFVATVICVVANIRESLPYDKFFHEWMFSHDRLAEPIGMQAVYFAMYISLTILIILNALLYRHASMSIWVKVLVAVLFAYFILMIILLGARTITVSLIMIIIAHLVVVARSRKVYKLLWIAAFLPVVFIGVIAFHPVLRTRFIDLRYTKKEESNYDSYFARLNIWVPGMEVIKENFWLGTGTGDHQVELDKKFISNQYLEGVQAYNMHNQYLQTLLSNGVVGLLALFFILLVQVKRGIVQKDVLYLSFLALFSAGSITEAMLSRNKGIVFFVVFSLIFFKSMTNESQGEQERTS